MREEERRDRLGMKGGGRERLGRGIAVNCSFKSSMIITWLVSVQVVVLLCIWDRKESADAL
jgi:hypothetical protein